MFVELEPKFQTPAPQPWLKLMLVQNYSAVQSIVDVKHVNKKLGNVTQ